MTALFWGSFATVRGLAVFGAICLSPDIIMWSSLFTALGKTFKLLNTADGRLSNIYFC